MTLAWPDTLELPPLPELASEPEVQYADLQLSGPQLAFSEAVIEEIGEDVILGFPQREPPFEASGDFVDRFAALSTINNLDNDSDNLPSSPPARARIETLLENMLRVYAIRRRVIRSIGGVEPGRTKRAAQPVVRFDIVQASVTDSARSISAISPARPTARICAERSRSSPGFSPESHTIVQERADLDGRWARPASLRRDHRSRAADRSRAARGRSDHAGRARGQV